MNSYIVILISTVILFLGCFWPETAHASARKENLRELTHEAYRMLEEGRAAKSAELYMKAVGLYDEKMDAFEKRECIKAFSNLGYIQLFEYHCPERAYPLLVKAREMAKAEGFHDILGAVYGNIAKLYDDFGDTHNALMNFRLGMEACSLPSSTKEGAVIRLMVFDDLASTAIHRNLIDSIGDCLRIFRRLPVDDIPMSRYSNELCKALELASSREYGEAVSTLSNAFHLIDAKVDRNRYIVNHYLVLAALLNKNGQHSEALAQLQVALDEARESKFTDLKPRILDSMSLTYRELGDTAEADRLRLESLEVSDSLYCAHQFGKIRDIESTDRIDSLSQSFEIAKIELSHKRRLMWILGIGISVILALLCGLAVRTRKLAATHRELARRHRDILTERKVSDKLIEEYSQKITNLETENAGLSATLENARASADDRPSISQEEDDDEIKKEARSRMKVPGLPEDHLRIVERIKETLKDNAVICDPDFSLERLAALVGSKPKYVSSLIRDMLQSSFSQLLAEVRIEESCRLLMDDTTRKSMSMEAIAEAVGYRSRTHFCSVFKKITGLSPSKYVSVTLQNNK